MRDSIETRRGFIKSLGAGHASLRAVRRRVLRVAHLTDSHVQPKLRAAEGLAACLRHVQAQDDAHQLILNTGDCIMDSMKCDRARTELQWRVWNSVWRAECSLPVEHAIGNHDVWGRNKAKSQTTGSEARWGKAWALDALGLGRSYRRSTAAGGTSSHLTACSTSRTGTSRTSTKSSSHGSRRTCRRRRKTTPVLVLSHIPVFSIAPLMDPKSDLPDDGSKIGRAGMHDDCRIKNLFKRHPNVKAAVSGHIHLVDRVDYPA